MPDVGEVDPARWPAFASGLSTLKVCAIYSLPLSIGSLTVGAVDLYAEETNTFTPAALVDATDLAGVAATEVLRHALQHRHDEAADDGPHSRREVHQATGMVIAQMRVSAADALLLIRAHAFAAGRSVRETASDITSRRIQLGP